MVPLKCCHRLGGSSVPKKAFASKQCRPSWFVLHALYSDKACSTLSILSQRVSNIYRAYIMYCIWGARVNNGIGRSKCRIRSIAPIRSPRHGCCLADGELHATSADFVQLPVRSKVIYIATLLYTHTDGVPLYRSWAQDFHTRRYTDAIYLV